MRRGRGRRNWLGWMQSLRAPPPRPRNALRTEGRIHRLVVCDIDASKADDLEADAHYTSMEAMMANEQLHGVAIVHPETRLSLAQQAFEDEAAVLAGKTAERKSRGQPAVPLYRRRQGSGGGLRLRHHPGLRKVLIRLRFTAKRWAALRRCGTPPPDATSPPRGFHPRRHAGRARGYGDHRLAPRPPFGLGHHPFFNGARMNQRPRSSFSTGGNRFLRRGMVGKRGGSHRRSGRGRGAKPIRLRFWGTYA